MLIYTVNDRYGVYTYFQYIRICSVRTAVAIKKKALKLYCMHMSVDIFYIRIRNNIFLLYININVFIYTCRLQ